MMELGIQVSKQGPEWIVHLGVPEEMEAEHAFAALRALHEFLHQGNELVLLAVGEREKKVSEIE
jgi:hypothetical protein